ncbi:hypothetical protein, partial [Aeromonas veronii]|uniref:hypothetical protein n=1 Tax=Aeromonas veronii TaxID=654 RepID=UPI001957FCCE
MLLFGVIRRKQQIILSYTQNSKWNSATDGLKVFSQPLWGKGAMMRGRVITRGKLPAVKMTKTENGQNRREADASLLV